MKIDKPGPHLDHMLRQTRLHHAQLSSMADMKANMLMTMSSVVITLSAPHLFSPLFRWPVIILGMFCFLTIVLAIYAVMPKVPLSFESTAPPDIHSPTFNLLFFGDFIRLDYAHFEAAMEEIMNDPSRTYQAQIREIYTLGRFLALKKYRTLRLAYLSFVIGLIASGATLIFARELS